MEILDINVLLPATVRYTTEAGTFTAFCYFNYLGDVIVTDEIADTKELQRLIVEYIKSKRRNQVIPPIPEKGFDKLDPSSYTNFGE